MSVMVKEIFEAFVEAGASRETATAAAAVVPVTDNLATKTDLAELRLATKTDLAELGKHGNKINQVDGISATGNPGDDRHIHQISVTQVDGWGMDGVGPT